MIKINIVAVGKVKESYYAEGIAEYLKRLTRYAEVKITEVKEVNFSKDSEENRLVTIKKEGEGIKRELKGYTVAMAIEGKKYTSEEFASFINKAANENGVITFIIGGSYGIDEDIKKNADAKISISDMTLPHTLCRLVLTEQIYRAFTILSNGQYHK